MLEYQSGWAESLGGPLLPEQGAWLYALLCRIEKPLHPDVTAALRTLAIVCSRSRQRVAVEGKHLKDLNALTLLICLVAKYFDQADMAD